LFHLRLHLILQHIPGFVGASAAGEELFQVQQRVAPGFHLEHFRAFVSLGIAEGMPGQAGYLHTQQARSFAPPYPCYRFLDYRRGLLWFPAARLEHPQTIKIRKVGGDIASGGLQRAGYRDAKTVVFDKEQQGQLEGGRHIQGGPKTVGRRAALAPAG
jgi:hypothetical protein